VNIARDIFGDWNSPKAILKAAKSRSFRDLQGCLKGKTNGRVLSIEAINEAIEESAIAAMERK
jgi:hypothetical protein